MFNYLVIPTYLMFLVNSTAAMSLVHNSTLQENNMMRTTEDQYVSYVKHLTTLTVPAIFAFIFIIGVVGNGTLIAIISLNRKMRTAPNIFIFSLALADLLIIITTLPITSIIYTEESWPWNTFFCIFSEFLKDVLSGVCVFTLAALSADRYFAVVSPFSKFLHGVKRAKRIKIAIALWILSIFFAIPSLISTHIKDISISDRRTISACYPYSEEWALQYVKTIVLLRFLIYYIVPLIIIGVFYFLMARHLMIAANVPGEKYGAVELVNSRRKVGLTGLTLTIIFGVCYLPSHIFMLWFYYCPTTVDDYNLFWHVFRIVGFCLSFFHSCTSPVGLYFSSKSLRKHYNSYFLCNCMCNKYKQWNASSIGSVHYNHSRKSRITKSDDPQNIPRDESSSMGCNTKQIKIECYEMSNRSTNKNYPLDKRSSTPSMGTCKYSKNDFKSQRERFTLSTIFETDI